MKRSNFLSIAAISASALGLMGSTARGVDVQAGVSVQPSPEASAPVIQQPAPAAPAAPVEQAAPPAPATSADAKVRLPYGVEDVLKLSRGNVSEDVVVAYIQSTGTIYNLNANDIVYLKQQGVSDRVIHAMLDERQRLISSQTAAAAQQQTAVQQQQADAAAQAQQQEPVTAPNAPVNNGSTVYTIPYSGGYAYGYDYPYYSPYSYSYSYPYYGGYYGPSFAFRFGSRPFFHGSFGHSFGHSGFGFHGGHGGFSVHGGGGFHHH